MGQRDISLVRYFEDQGRYADLINGFVFNGEQVISDNDVQEMDSRITGVFGKLKKRFMVQKYRDCVRKIVFGMGFAVIGIEHQDKIHYGMPIRIMLEDAGEYDKQLRQLKRYHRNKRDLRGDEFLGGIARVDRVYPVFTICIYYGSTPYDGAKELHQILDCDNLPQKLKRLVNNYRIQVLEVREFQNIDCFKTDLREVFGFIQRSGDADAERTFTFDNEDRFRALDEDAFDVIVSVTNTTELEKMKADYRDEGGKINMCEAIRGMVESGRMEGMKEGVREGIKALVEVCQDFGISKAETASKIMTKFSISQEEAERDTEQYWRS